MPSRSWIASRPPPSGASSTPPEPCSTRCWPSSPRGAAAPLGSGRHLQRRFETRGARVPPEHPKTADAPMHLPPAAYAGELVEHPLADLARRKLVSESTGVHHLSVVKGRIGVTLDGLPEDFLAGRPVGR